MNLGLNLILSIIAATSTFHLSKISGPIIASTLTTLVYSLLIYFLPLSLESEKDIILFCIYGSSFVGMSSNQFFTYRSIIIFAITYSFIFQYITSQLGGLGGSLGFSAFLAVVIVTTLKTIGKKYVQRKGISIY